MFFFLYAFKAAFRMRHLKHRWTQSGYLSVLSPNAGKYKPEKLRILSLFTQWNLANLLSFDLEMYKFYLITELVLFSEVETTYGWFLFLCICFLDLWQHIKFKYEIYFKIHSENKTLLKNNSFIDWVKNLNILKQESFSQQSC